MTMMTISRAAALVLLAGAAALPTPAIADDPRDPSMQTREARERDREIIRRLNLEQLDFVRKRDAEYAKGWKATKEYEANKRRREAEQRRAIELCEDGYYEYCPR